MNSSKENKRTCQDDKSICPDSNVHSGEVVRENLDGEVRGYDEPDWVKEHIAKYGKEPNLFDGD